MRSDSGGAATPARRGNKSLAKKANTASLSRRSDEQYNAPDRSCFIPPDAYVNRPRHHITLCDLKKVMGHLQNRQIVPAHSEISDPVVPNRRGLAAPFRKGAWRCP